MSGLHPDVASYRERTIACPVQIEGQLTTGQWFYFRYRWGQASIGIGDSPQQANHDQFRVGCSVPVRHGDGFQGAFATDDERNAVFAAALANRRAAADA